MRIDGIAGIEALARGPGPANEDRAKVRDGAGKFEAFLIAQMLKSAREAGSGGLMGAGESQTDSTMLELAEECFAEMLSSRGGLGLGRLIEQHLARNPTGASAGTSATVKKP